MKHSISAVARMANLSPDVIRTWERRYEVVTPERDASGVRLYSDDDAERLALAGKATRLGHPIRRVALLSNERLRELVDVKPAEASDNGALVARLLDAVHANALSDASKMLRTAAMLVPLRELVLDILAPALREVGRQWENGELTIWQEHFLSNEVLGIAGTLQDRAPAQARIVLATPPFERHGFGIALAGLLAAARGVAVCNLGVGVPSPELIAAARQLRAVTVVVGMTREALPQTEATQYVRELDAGLSPGIDLLLGGAAGASLAESMKRSRVRGVATLEEFDGLCPQWR